MGWFPKIHLHGNVIADSFPSSWSTHHIVLELGFNHQFKSAESETLINDNDNLSVCQLTNITGALRNDDY
jgi:hypothetical protein